MGMKVTNAIGFVGYPNFFYSERELLDAINVIIGVLFINGRHQSVSGM